MSTQPNTPTEAHLAFAAAHMVQCPWPNEYPDLRAKVAVAAQLIADSEARAVERWSGRLDMSLPDLYEAAKAERDKANAALTAEREKVRVLREALESIVVSEHLDGCCPYGCDAPTIAHNALAATKEGA